MFNFFKKTKKSPRFETLAGFAQKEAYFIRTAQWMTLDKARITVIDPHQPRMLTMDPWPQIVFLEADGQKTVAEFIAYMAGNYSGAIPEELDKTIIEELLKVVDYKIVQFSEKKGRPEARFDDPRKSGK
jgi:hypothetical protein